ncbi:MAG TPA: hypothetical protein VJG13_15345, partial [Thermoanaerobaculia bacterium]|nr:hypothetical protein [Thermoanaerobaculia bacterium]
MRNALSSPYPFLAILGLLAAAIAAPAAAAEPGEPYLVRDIDTTGEAYFPDCHVTCPPPTPIFGSLIEQLTPFGDLLAFVANDRLHGFEPWISDGTSEGTRLLADVCPGACDSSPELLGVLDGRLYFWAVSPASGGADLWVSDGSPEGTRPLTELCPELCGTLGEGPGVVFEGALFFSAYDAVQSRRFLWRTDGTPAGTDRVVPVCTRTDVCFESFSNFFVYRGRLFFNDWANLRRLDRPEAEPAIAWAGTPDSAARLGDQMILAVDASFPGLWIMDGPLAVPRLLAAVGAGASVSQLTAVDGFVYFVRSSGQGHELWRTDGTAEGTEATAPFLDGRLGMTIVGILDGGLVVRVHPDPGLLPVVPPTLWWLNPAGGPQEALSSLPVQSVAVVGDRIFFSAEGGEARGRELWLSDGTGEGTELHADIAPGPPSSEPGNGGRFVTGFAAAGDRLFFPAHH